MDNSAGSNHQRGRWEAAWIYSQVLIILIICVVLLKPGVMKGQEKGRVVVLPFKMHAQESLAHLKEGLQEMLSLRMEEHGYQTVSLDVVNEHIVDFLPVLEAEELPRLGAELEADWVIQGSLTRIAKRVSIDLKVVNVGGERAPFFVYRTAETVDGLAPMVTDIAESIDNEIRGIVQVASVRVEGNQRIESDAILAVASTEEGENLSEKQLDQDLRDIYRMGYFRDVKIETEDEPSGKIVTFHVTEKPSISRIVFDGNKEMDDEKLRGEIGIKRYSILDRSEIKESVNRLKEFYRKEGYYNAEIEEELEPEPGNKVLLRYKIQEKEKVYIAEIRFRGNSSFDDDELRDLMKTSERGLFSWITDSGRLDKKKLEYDTYKIEAFYHNNGFIHAVVGEPEVSFKEDKGLLITIEIKEGDQYRVDQVAVKGDLIRSEEELLEEVRIREEEVFNREVLRKDVTNLKDIYANKGFAYAEIKPLTKEDKKNKLVDVIYSISKGKKVYFERINIGGNTYTRDKVIRRELEVVERDEFSAKSLKRSTRNLNRLGYFEDVKIDTKKGSREDLMILDIDVKEKPTGSLSFGAGYSSEENIIGMLKISQDNLFGYGQKLSASMKIGGESNQFDVSFIEPWLLDRPISASMRAYKWEREYDEYTKDAWGGEVGFGYPLRVIDEDTRVWSRYTYENADITDVSPDASRVIRDMEGHNVTSSMSGGIKRNSTDRAWNPSRGSINSITIEYAGGPFGGDNYFTKYTANSTWFFPLFWDTVFMCRGKWGYVEERSGGDLPVYEKFFLGGINTVRGFDYGEISPRDPETGDRIGGEKMMLYNVEYKFPLPYLEEQGVIGLIFYDAGNCYTEDESYSFSDLRDSIGAGIRWYSPIGPLRLEWGYNLDPKRDEDESQWEFTIGTRFF